MVISSIFKIQKMQMIMVMVEINGVCMYVYFKPDALPNGESNRG